MDPNTTNGAGGFPAFASSPAPEAAPPAGPTAGVAAVADDQARAVASGDAATAVQRAAGPGSDGGAVTRLVVPTGMTEAQAQAIVAAFGEDALAEIAATQADDNVNVHGADQALGRSFPRIAIEHGMSKATAQFHRGWITDLMAMTQFEHLEVVLLARKRGRVMWPPRDQGQEASRQPLCTSNDCVRRSGGSSEEIPADQQCVRCIHSQWTVGQGGQRTPPQCPETFVDLLWDVQAEYPRVLTSKRAGAKRLGAMRDQLKFAGTLAVRHLGLPSMFPWSLAVSFRLCGVPVESKRGEPYFVPGIVDGSVRELDLRTVQTMYQALKVLRPIFTEQDIGQQAGGEEEAAPDGDDAGDVDGSGGHQAIVVEHNQIVHDGSGATEAPSGAPAGAGGQPAIRKFGNR